MRTLVLLSVLGVLPAAPVRPVPAQASAGRAVAGEGLRPGDHEFHVEHGGRSRRYVVHVPRSRGREPLALVMALHGGGGSARQFQAEAGLDAVADREGFLVAYPDGSGRFEGRLLTWNAGRQCCGWAMDRGVDDVGFLVMVLDDISRRTPVDARRVFATGHSNGSMMAHRLAAERAQRVTAVAAVGGAPDLPEVHPVRPVAVLHIHSTDDPRALYGGGLGPAFPGTDRRVQHQPVVSGLAAWAAANGCSAATREGAEVKGSGRDAGQSLVRLEYVGCPPDGVVEHLRLAGSGHGWPGTEVRGARRRLLGPGTTLVDAAEEAWRFFRRFTRDSTPQTVARPAGGALPTARP